MSPKLGLKQALSQLSFMGLLWRKGKLWMWGRKKERKLCHTSWERWAWEIELIWQLSIFASNWITVCRWGTLQENITQVSQESHIWKYYSNTREVIDWFSFFYYSEIFLVYVPCSIQTWAQYLINGHYNGIKIVKDGLYSTIITSHFTCKSERSLKWSQFYFNASI